MTTEVQLLELLQKYTLFNQSSLIKYLFGAHFKHQAIREELMSGLNKKEVLKNKIIELEDYFEEEFSKVAEKTCWYLRQYFTKKYCSDRSDIPLRVAIKVLVEKNKITSLERFPECNYEEFESTAAENSAFAALSLNDEIESLDDGIESYFCNSIPNAIAENRYINNRIDMLKARDYIRKVRKGLITPDSSNSIDEQWAKCWRKVKDKFTGEKKDPPPKSCYKSTIVLPISLNPGDLESSEFEDFFNINAITHVDQGKVILGYLCLDHPLERYFRKKTDVKMADMFSKFISFYMLAQLAYTQYSPIYFTALEVIGDL